VWRTYFFKIKKNANRQNFVAFAVCIRHAFEN
jgi:hypothetical protein